jgi:hypothetical protein
MLQIEAIVGELNTQLQQKRYATFFPFGNFFQNENKGVFFVARQQFNLHLPNYGLQPLKWESKVIAEIKPLGNSSNTLNPQHSTSNALQTEPEEAKIVAVSEEHIEAVEKQQQANMWWNVAASFAVISVSALTLTIASLTWVGAYQEKQAYASLNPVIHTTAEMASEESNIEAGVSNQTNEKNASFIYINGTLVKIEAENQAHSPSQNALENTSVNPDNAEQNPTSRELNLLDAETYQSYLLDQKQGDFFLVSGSYLTPNAAKIECQQWIGQGTPAAIFKPQNSSFYRIVLGRFVTKEEASEYSVTLKTISNANLSMTRWNLR